MKEPFVEAYKGHLLHCQPNQTPAGEFLAHVVISFAERGGHTDVAITPEHSPFERAREAADHALAVGKQWVDQNT